MKENLIIIGSSGHAKVIIDAVEKQNIYNIAGLIDDYKKTNVKVCNYKIIGKIKNLSLITKKHNINNCFIAIGDNYSRKIVSEMIMHTTENINFVNIIHPTAILSADITNKKGIYIAAGSIINKEADISDFTIINTGAIIEHDCFIDNYSSIGPAATLSGNVKVGYCSAVGVNATIIEKTTIGNNCVIGAGTVVTKDIPDNSVVVGIPGKVIKTREPFDKYLK